MNLQVLSDKVGYLDQTYHYYTLKEFFVSFVKILTFSTTESIAGSLWFIPLLFYTTIVFGLVSYLLQKVLKNNSEYLRFIIIAILFSVGCNFQLYGLYSPRGISDALIVVFIFYIGYQYCKHESAMVYNIYLFIPCLVLLGLNSVYGTLSIGGNIVNPPFLLLNSLLGVYVSIYTAKKLLKYEKVKSILKYIGNNTWFIMAFHELSFKVINLVQIQVYDYPSYMLGKRPVIDGAGIWWILYSLCGVLIPIIVKYSVDATINRIMSIPVLRFGTNSRNPGRNPVS
jgi:fucose 4-O-acetylase-like acetyltransferase